MVIHMIKSQCRLFDDVYEFFSLIDTFINVCVVTNQSGIGRGYFSVHDMENFNEEINKLIRFNTSHRGIDRFFFALIFHLICVIVGNQKWINKRSS